MKALELQEACPACGVEIGQSHQPGCSIERCPFCGHQMLQDRCCYTFFGIDPTTMEEEWKYVYEHGLPEQMVDLYEKHLHPHLLKWDGVYPGVRECREYNLWSKWTPHGWQKCDADDPDSSEDLNELAMRSYWDRKLKKYVLHQCEP